MFTMIADDESVIDSKIHVPCFSVGGAMRELRHVRVSLLKLDIEGAEYEAIDGMLEQDIPLPEQLLVEFHHRLPGIGLIRTQKSIERLLSVGYKIFAVSPTGREVSFVHELAL